MLRKYLSDIAFVQALNLLVKPVWILVIDRAVQNALSSDIYGNYFALLNLSLIFFIVLDLGITGFNTTQLSKDQGKIKELFGNLLGLKILLAFLYIFLLFLFAIILGYGSIEFELLLLIGSVQILTSFNQYFRSSISAFQMFRYDGVFMVLDRLIIIALCAVLLWANIPGFELSIGKFIGAQLLGVALVSLTLLAFISLKLERIKLGFNLRKILPLLKKSWPFGLLVALMGLYNYMDGVMLKSLAISGNGETDIYAMGYRLYFALFMFAQIFSNVLLAMYGKHITEKKTLSDLSNYTTRLLLWIALFVGLFSFAYGNEIIALLYPKKYSGDAVQSFIILIFSFAGSALILVYGTLLTAKEQLRKLNRAALFTLIINFSLNMILIPKQGAKGAAIATLASQTLFGIWCFFLAQKDLELRLKKGFIFKGIFVLILFFVVIVVLKQYLNNVTVHMLMITLSLILSAYLIRLFKLRLFKSTASK